MIGNQRQAALPRPVGPHVLQFALFFGTVMAMAENDAGHRIARLGRTVKMSRDQQSPAALEDDVLDLIAAPPVDAGRADVQVLRRSWKLS